MGLFSDIFGSSSTASTSTNQSTTLTNSGSGLAATGVTGNIVYNDPSAAVAALDANAYTVNRSLNTVDKAVQGNTDISQNALSGALKVVGDTVQSANALLSNTQQLYYNKIADNAGVAPQTLQQQQQAASSDLLKLAVFGALALGAIILLSKSSK